MGVRTRDEWCWWVLGPLPSHWVCGSECDPLQTDVVGHLQEENPEQGQKSSQVIAHVQVCLIVCSKRVCAAAAPIGLVLGLLKARGLLQVPWEPVEDPPATAAVQAAKTFLQNLQHQGVWN